MPQVAAIASQLQSLETFLDGREPPDGTSSEAATSLEELAVAVEELRVASDELAQVDLQLRQQQVHYRELFEMAPAGIFVTDAQAVIVEANRAACRLTQRPLEVLRGKPLAALLDAEDDAIGFHRRIAPALSGAEGVAWDGILRAADGGRVPVHLSCAPSHDVGGAVSGLQLFATDITQRVEAEERQRVQTTLLERARETQRERLARLERSKLNFLSLASHELRGPLGLIRGYLSLVDAGDLSAERVTGLVPILLERCETLDQLIDRMLDTVRLESGELSLDRRVVDLRALAERAVAGLEPMASRSGHRIILEMAERPVTVLADPPHIVTVLLNLLDNAVRYSPGADEVRCRVAVDGATALLSVTDHGVGVAPGTEERVFRRFASVATSETSHLTGLGLGLYVAREVARQHGGDVVIAGSRPGVGSEFQLRLPLTPAA